MKDTEDVYILDKLSMGWSVCPAGTAGVVCYKPTSTPTSMGFLLLGEPLCCDQKNFGKEDVYIFGYTHWSKT